MIKNVWCEQNMIVSNQYRMDEVDKRIIELIQKEPHLTHTQIAQKVNRSQPTVGMRIKKLEDLGILQFQAGINLKSANLNLGKVDIFTTEPDLILKIAKECPFVINAFRTSGISNVSIFIASKSLIDLDKITNAHFRTHPNVKRINLETISDIANNFLIPLDFNFKQCSCVSNKYADDRELSKQQLVSIPVMKQRKLKAIAERA